MSNAVRLHHQEIARGVGRHVSAILLGRVAGGAELHASLVMDAELVAHLHVDIGDGVSHGAALLVGRVGALGLGHHGPNLGEVFLAEGVGRLHLASISVADRHGVALRRGRAKSGIMDAEIARTPINKGLGAAGKASGEEYHQHAA
ncbi:MAG: hypothetical protein WAM06_08875 [Methyloceanibacter sp.]